MTFLHSGMLAQQLVLFVRIRIDTPLYLSGRFSCAMVSRYTADLIQKGLDEAEASVLPID